MFEKILKKFETEGKLKKQKAGVVQVENLLKEAILDLEEAKKISHIADRATYLMAYMAMLKAGGALLSRTEAAEAFADAISLVKRILAEAKSRNPQLEIEF